jgi:hypothetical protein
MLVKFSRMKVNEIFSFGCPDQADLSLLSYSSCPVPAVLFELSSINCSRLLWVSCTLPVLVILSFVLMFRPTNCPVPGLLSCGGEEDSVGGNIGVSGLSEVSEFSPLKGLSHEIEMNYKWYKSTEPN